MGAFIAGLQRGPLSEVAVAASPDGRTQATTVAYFDLGSYRWPVTTSDAEAQLWFDRGMAWCYGFHHEEAIACFERALLHDLGFAMAHWGIAYAIGPNCTSASCGGGKRWRNR